MNSFKVNTAKNKFNINYVYDYISKDQVKTDKVLFAKMCKTGCVNYNKKYSCPPFSPDFSLLSKDSDGLFVVLFVVKLDQIKSTEYNKIRIANVVMKSKINRLMRDLETNFKTKFLSTGSCNLCKPCNCKLKLSCKHPDKKRYSLESVGIDCNNLSETLFNTQFLWYKEKNAPAYTSVICGLLCNKKDVVKLRSYLDSYDFSRL
ncbi:MAG: DUF2284 domain-containing protein [Candidatus Pacearchaeota archaeon]|jgi:predicted metal-binding protein